MKHILSLCLALALTLGLCACGQPSQPSAGSSGGPSWQEQYDLGLRYLSEGKYQEAILAFTAAIEIDPKQAPAYVGRGNACVLSGETEDSLTAAQADFEQAIALDELLAEAYLGLADVYIRRGDYDKAREVLEQGLAKIGTSEAISAKLEELDSGNISDSSGYVRRESAYDGAGNLLYWLEFTPGPQGGAVTLYEATGTEKGHLELAVDSEGRPLTNYSVIIHDNGTHELAKVEYDYDSAGNQTEARHYEPDGNLSSYFKNKYNAAGQMVQSHYYGADGQLFWSSAFEYDSAGNQIKAIYYDSNGQLTNYRTVEYDAEGNWTRNSFYDANGQLTSYLLPILNEQGNIIGQERFDANGNRVGSTLYG